MDETKTVTEQIAADIWLWMREFVAVKNDFYGAKFPPCPFAQKALLQGTVDVAVWESGDVKRFVRERAENMRDTPTLTTRVMAFPPRIQLAWGISDFVESLNRELIADNLFLNTGVTKTMPSRYPASGGNPYFIVVANSLDAVLKGVQDGHSGEVTCIAASDSKFIYSGSNDGLVKVRSLLFCLFPAGWICESALSHCSSVSWAQRR